MHSEGYSSWFVCLCVDTYSGTIGYEAASELRKPKKQKGCVLRDMPWKQAKKPICIIALDLLRPDPLALCTLGVQEVATRACINSRMLSTCAASLCETLRELLAGDHE